MSAPDVPGALLLGLDLQTLFLRVIPEADRVIRRCRFAFAAARGLGVRVALTEQVPERLGPTDPQVLAGLEPLPRWPKNTFSALADDRIIAQLRERQIEHLLLCGIETPICVYQTAIEALNADLQVTVLSDAIGGRRADDAVVALDALARAGAHVLPAESVFYALLHDAGHPFFKTFTDLVKSHG